MDVIGGKRMPCPECAGTGVGGGYDRKWLDIWDSPSHVARVNSRNACRPVRMEPTAGRRSARGLSTGALE